MNRQELLASAAQRLILGRTQKASDEIVAKMQDALHGLLANLLVLDELVIVDMNPVYQSMFDDDDLEVDLYKQCCLPVFRAAVLGFTNKLGATQLIVSATQDLEKEPEFEPWVSTENDIDWSQVRWITRGLLQVADHAHVSAPIMHVEMAITETGELLDIHWMILDKRFNETMKKHKFDVWVAGWLYTLNLLSCRNVVLLPSTYSGLDRHARRRISRTGVKLHTLHITPTGSYRRNDNPVAKEFSGSMPLHSVRGHTRTYGSDGRKLLFGKYAGKFFIPNHIRGNPLKGEVVKGYIIDGQ